MAAATQFVTLLISASNRWYQNLVQAVEKDCGGTCLYSSNIQIAPDSFFPSVGLIVADLDHDRGLNAGLLSDIRCRVTDCHVPVVALVPAGTTSESVAQVLRSGANDCLVAPWSWPELAARIAVHRGYAEAIARFRRDCERAQRDLESMNAIINTVVAHDSLIEDQLDGELKTAKFQAEHDPLTQALNRLGFTELLTKELAAADQDGGVALIMMDIDHFKCVNDTYGHDAGDRVLLALARRVRELLPAACSLARWGGEEFMILAPGFAVPQAGALAEYLRISVEKLAISNTPSVTCSFGVTAYLLGESLEVFLKRVDESLYEAKEHGRNMVHAC